MSDCIFCDPSKIRGVIFHDQESVVFEPLNPVVGGHICIAPITHVTDFTENPHISGRIMEIAANVAARLGGDFNLITSKGRAATQSIMHLHVHLVPRKEGDGLHLPWTGQKTNSAVKI
jgi:histidine triad (HIT) family protein